MTEAEIRQIIDAETFKAGMDAAYERGKAEGLEEGKQAERARIEARLQAKREWDNSLAENAYELGAPPVNVASFRIAKQVWDMAIEIVNQTEE